ncbi:DUF2254 domain-containing protein [Tropicimonas sp. IMCC6043]|uniref:DUF2254 domain-containing protein n=1 Tax=Tropicimonas sp. IMCC6043 TaxID=2510645 RepID=UPI0013E9A8D3|nr:DUF2254 domain-containing protein [Tropicimonas sp. IMCC6043]
MMGILRRLLVGLRRQFRRLGLRVALYAALAVAVALAGALIAPVMPAAFTGLIKPEAVMPVLDILASSMLAVSTFSLGVMVSAQNGASDRATPRIHRLMLADRTTQSVLAAFVGAFVYALTAILMFRTGLYPDEVAVLVMGVTIAVVVLVVVAMLRWIEHLSWLGSLDESMRIATEDARTSLANHARQPALRAVPLTDDVVLPGSVTPVPARDSGYVQFIDVAAIEACLPGVSRAYVTRAPGRHVLAGQPLALVSGQIGDAALRGIADCFVTGQIRTSEQDPEFGIMTLSETASRALSPGVNDPGTAIEAIERLQTLLWDYARDDAPAKPPRATRVFLPVPGADRLIEAAFGAIARDGAGVIEVAMELRRALLTLAQSPNVAINEAARALSDHALDHAEAALVLETEKERLRSVGKKTDA